MFGNMRGWPIPGTERQSVVLVVHGGAMVYVCVGRCFHEMEVGGFGWAEFLAWERVLVLLGLCT